MPGWHDFPVKEHLQDAFGVPVFVDNDANIMALGGSIAAPPGYGPVCACGARGCLAASASGAAIALWPGDSAALAPASITTHGSGNRSSRRTLG